MPKPGQRTNPRPDKIEFEKRLTTILGWVYDGAPSALIVGNIEQKGWAKSERHAYMLLKKAKERMVKYDDDTQEQKRRQRVQELKMRIRTLGASYRDTPSGLRVILQYERLIAQIEGLLQHNHSNDDDLPPSPQQAFMQPVDLSFAPGEVNAISKQLDEEY
jgi:hypothetical protein